MVVLGTYAKLLGLLVGGRVDVSIPERAPIAARLGFAPLSSLELTATPRDAPAPLPLESCFISGDNVVLGWKFPALLLAPLWLIVRPAYLPLLLILWFTLPGSGSGALDFEFYLRADSLSRGVWRFMLGLVLDGIGRSSLPGLLATLNDDGTQTPLPRSQCTGVSVARGGKLVLDGQLAGSPRLNGGAPIDYTLRMGMRAGHVERDGTVAAADAYTGGLRSCLTWDSPELKLSLGDGNPLVRLLPALWVPVLASCGVALPKAVRLRRAVVSEAGDGVSAAGRLELAPNQVEEGGQLAVMR